MRTFFLFLAAVGIGCAHAPPLPPPTVILNACVLNDAKYPSPVWEMERALGDLDEYRDKVDIGFRITRGKPFVGNAIGDPNAVSAIIEKACPEPHDLAILFTDRMLRDNENGRPLTGRMDPVNQVILMLGMEQQMSLTDQNGRSIKRCTILHEVGHFFGFDDEQKNRLTFMFKSCGESLGDWTPEFIEALKRKRDGTSGKEQQ